MTKKIEAPSTQPIIGRLMDQISALPVLWGLNEPGALLRNSDVFRVLAAAGREQAALAAASVQAQEPVTSDPRPLFDRKLADLEQRGYEVIGRILHKNGQYALFDSSCRWLESDQYQRLMHEQDGSLFAAPVRPLAVPDVWLKSAIKSVRAEERRLGSVIIGGKTIEGIGLSFMVQQLGYAVDALEKCAAAPAAQGDAANTHAAQIGATSHLIAEQIFNIATPYFLWTKDGAACDGWQRATAGAIGMPGLLSFAKALIEAAQMSVATNTCAEMRALCSACGGTGDVHRADGEWRGQCTCVHAWQQRAEKAEANYKIVCDKNDRLLKLVEHHQAIADEWQGKAEDALARAKELEAQLARRGVPLSPEMQQAIAAARAAGQSIAATPGGLVFMNDGAELGSGELDCPACGGSGHAGDVAAGSAP